MKFRIKKKSVVVFFLSAFTCISCSDNLNSDLKELDLNGSVSEIYITEYEAIQEGKAIRTGNPFDVQKITFNKDGNILEDIDFDKNMDVYQSVVNSYNSDGKKLQSDVINEGKLLVNWIYSHNPKERTMNVKVYDKKGILFKEDDLFFDEVGRVVEEKNYRNDRDWFFQRKYSYDEDGNLIEKKVFAQGEIINREEYFFDDKKVEKYEYNRDNNLILKEIHIVDDNKNPVEIKRFGTGLFSDSDELNLLGSIKYEYLYDNKKNWIKLIQYNKHAEAVNIIERRISYYY